MNFGKLKPRTQDDSLALCLCARSSLRDYVERVGSFLKKMLSADTIKVEIG